MTVRFTASYIHSSFSIILRQREKKKPGIGKEYFNYMNLEGIVAAYPYRKNLPEEDIMKGLYAVCIFFWELPVGKLPSLVLKWNGCSTIVYCRKASTVSSH